MPVEDTSLFAQRVAGNCAEDTGLTTQRRYRSEMRASDNKENNEEKEARGRRRAVAWRASYGRSTALGVSPPAFRRVAARHCDSMTNQGVGADDLIA